MNEQLTLFPDKDHQVEAKPDVLGLHYEAIWLIAEHSKVSKARVRRVLEVFGPMFFERIGEAYNLGIKEGAEKMAGMVVENMQAASDQLLEAKCEASGRAKNILDDFLVMFTMDEGEDDDLADDPALD